MIKRRFETSVLNLIFAVNSLNVSRINIYDNTKKLKLVATIVDGEIKRTTSLEWVESIIKQVEYKSNI